MPSASSYVLPTGYLILVTGANGYIGSHVVEEALKLGYRVRGVVRSPAKLGNLRKRWEDRFPGKFEVAVVSDLQKEGAFDEAMKGVDAVAHIAAVSGDFTTDVAAATATVTNIELRALEAAADTPSVKRFVLTSSSLAAYLPQPDVEVEIGQESYNEASKELAKQEGPIQAFAVYMASKTNGEQAAWAWVKEHKPAFEFKTVLPDFNVGTILDPEHQEASTAGWLLSLWNREPNQFVSNVNGQNYIAVTDTALLHLGALLLPSIVNQRIFGCAGSINVNEFLRVLKEIDPERMKDVKEFEGKNGKDLARYDTKGAEEILRELKKGEGWKGLEEAVRETVESMQKKA
ncbi:hypothetical protein JCM8547_003176 [Rhodosporidiobolus lusitaniae]